MLATDAVYRDSCGERVRRQMEHGPIFLEARAMCRAFGEQIKLAVYELRVKGPTLFRSNLCLLAGH